MAEPTDEALVAWLRLIRTPGIGPVAHARLIARFGDPIAALAAVPDLARAGGGRSPTIAPRASVEREMERVRRIGARYLIHNMGLYPRALGQIESAPPVLIVKGDLRLFDRPMVAMVGARNASAAAIRFARMLARDLASRQQVVVSGLARGIDTAAHEGAIEGGTIAVVAGGIDVVYPPENEALQARIGEAGLLIAEQPPGTEPRARHFPYRNRIIAGLAAGTVVVEAAPRSGSLITARHANDYGREVMAVPGSPLDQRAQGCNALIRSGATLVQSADDILETLAPIGRAELRAPPREAWRPLAAEPVAEPDDGDRQAIDSLLSPTPVSIDELIRQSGRPVAAMQMVLLELELAGRIEWHAGGRVSRLESVT